MQIACGFMSKKDDNKIITVRGLKKPIVLVGLMGAGKSTVGRRLAKVLGHRFIDSDYEIEHAAGCSISDIFAIHGEEIFRDLEERVIGRLLEEDGVVLATGGGAWMQPKVRRAIRSKAHSIWLRADLDILVERVQKRNHRPLLETGDKRAILSKLMDERNQTYKKADMVVDSGDGPHEDVVTDIITTLKDYIKSQKDVA